MEKDWKTFWFENKWATSSFLIKKFGIQRYDWSNYFRDDLRPGLKKLRDEHSYKRQDIKPEELFDIFADVWAFYWEEETKEDLPVDAEDFVKFCLSFRLSKIKGSNVSFLIDPRYVRRLPDFKDWEDNGYTYLSYFFLNFEPTASRLNDAKIAPEMFQNTTMSHLNINQAVDFLSNLYLFHFIDLSKAATDRKLKAAKEQFYFRYNETGFFHLKEARKLGFSTTIPFSYIEVKTRLRSNYAIELGLESAESATWSKQKYLSLHPKFDGNNCLFCDAPNPDFHHLLQRAIYPELTYHPENLVPLCSTSHNAITRNKDPILTSTYRQCIEHWKAAPEGSKAEVFYDLLGRFHDLATGRSADPED